MTMFKIKLRKLFLVFDSCQDVSCGNHVQNCDKYFTILPLQIDD